MDEALGDRDLQLHILSLPTKADLDIFVARMKKALRQDIEALQAETAHLGGRVEALETSVEDITPTLQAWQMYCKTHDQRIDSLLDRLMMLKNAAAGSISALEACQRLLHTGTLSPPFKVSLSRFWAGKRLTILKLTVLIEP